MIHQRMHHAILYCLEAVPALGRVRFKLQSRGLLLRVAELHAQSAGKERFETGGGVILVHAQGVT